MTVRCRIGGSVVVVDSAQDCTASAGDVVGAGDAGTGADKPPKRCFVANVLTRSIADTMLDIGASDSISSIVTTSDLLAANTKAPGKQKAVLLTPAAKRRYITRLAGNIATLASTYQTTIDFRDHVLLATRRGTQWKNEYDNYLGEIYRAATQDTALLRESALTWLDVHPFVAAMVDATSAVSAKPKTRKLTRQNIKRCNALIRRFKAASENGGFNKLLDGLERELAAYEGLTAPEALEKLRSSKA